MTISQPIPQSVSNDLELSMKALQTLARISFIALSLIGASASVVASGYPDRPVKVVVGFPAGQSTDLRARMLAQGMATLLKQAVIVDNRPGAAGGTSHVAVKNAPPDGYTLVMGTAGTLAINPSLYDKLPYDPIKDFEPVALFAGSPMVLFTSIASPVNNYREFVAHVSARPPGTITYGSAGSAAHIAMEMLKKQAGLDLLRVPYKGSPQMITDLIGGQIDFAFEPIGTLLPLLKGGRVKILGFGSLNRNPALPHLPTLAEQGLTGFEAVSWTAILAPKGTPATIVQQLNEAIDKVVKDPAIVEEFARNGSFPMGGTAAAAGKYIREENARWGKAVKAAGAQAD